MAARTHHLGTPDRSLDRSLKLELQPLKPELRKPGTWEEKRGG